PGPTASPARRRRTGRCSRAERRSSARSEGGGGLMTQHIGIVACMAEGPSLCYRTICAEGARLLGPRAHPEVSLPAYSLARYETFLKRGDMAGVAELMLSSANKLAGAGADFLIC